MVGATLPVWALALFAAVFAPFVARAVAVAFERRARDRTARLLEAASASSLANLAKEPRV